MGRFTLSIGNKIVALVGVVFFASLLSMVLFYALRQEQTIFHENREHMGEITETVSQGLQTIMLAGYADIAQNYAGRLKKMQGFKDFRILRSNGLEAFQDNKTIANVNARIGQEEFSPREEEKELRVLAADDVRLKQLLETKEKVSFSEWEGNEEFLTFLTPIPLQKACTRCHGKDQEVRGVLKLTASLASVRASIEQTRTTAYRMLGVAMVVGIGLVWLLIRFSVVRRIRRVTQAMGAVAQGHFDEKVPESGRDELGQMAKSFNAMSAEVLRSYAGLRQEQNKLTTIILSAKEAIIATNAAGEVVIVNPAAERILEKSREDILYGGFFNVVDDPDYVKAFLDKEGVDMPETLVFKNRILNFYAASIQDEEGRNIGSAALIRDVTEEKKLEEKLRAMSYTDKLTGLFNRRRMEELLHAEFERASRYSLNLGVLFFDVDHFKKFNDTYGHDIGDKVLEVIGRTAKDHFRNVDMPCRYGGEEFCIILPNTGPKGAFIAAERFRRRMEQTPVAEGGIKVTVSIGIAAFPMVTAPNWEAFLKLADNALYEGKRAGRNRVIMCDAEKFPEMDEVMAQIA
ncbi:MAG: diguanylate cyclase [Magnetococcales bacterium]|nr:diguanylate cyclase [Magnetococcales bacterium]